MLARLGIRRKLALLMLIMLGGIMLTATPFVVDRIGQARLASGTAQASTAARQVGVLIQDLQQERLLALGYLGTTQLEQTALVAQMETATDDVARLRAQAPTAAIMRQAAAALSGLVGLREQVLARAADPSQAYAAYHGIEAALLDALNLTDPVRADATGLRQLGALDALMRANEDASSAGAALVVLAADRQASRAALSDALAAQTENTRRFQALAAPGQPALLDEIEKGTAGQRIASLAAQAVRAILPATVADTLTAAVSYTGLRRVAQDRIAREIATAASQRATRANRTVVVVAGGAVLLLLVVVWLALAVSRSIAVPLGRLTRAAAEVAGLGEAELVRVADSDATETGPATARLAAVDIRGTDEVASLAAAFNRVQVTAAQLVERQSAARHNVAVMFANIARRTQNLVGRQRVLIDEVSRTDRNPQVQSRLYRLDRLTARLRRSADSLLVVSGTVDQGIGGDAPMLLADLIEAAADEVEGFPPLDDAAICEIGISVGLITDLRLLLSELLENAATFSPPDTPIEVTAMLYDGCRISIVDHGLGLPADRLAQENQRLVSRERLDVAPTTMLGLFVVGRLARRHRLRVRLDHTSGGGITATVDLPGSVLVPASATRTSGRPALPGVPRPQFALESSERFEWFGAVADEQLAAAGMAHWSPDGRVRPDGRPAPEPASAAGSPQVPTAGSPQAPPVSNGARPPAATTVTIDLPPPTTPSGLTRRIPGGHLVDELRSGPVVDRGVQQSTVSWAVNRDPEAERAAVDGFLAGFIRGSETTDQPPPDPPPSEGRT